MKYQKFLKPSSLLILLSLISGSSAFAQRYPVRTYTEADGLANSMVFDIKQDSSGIIWIARRSGISSYDGISFNNYNVSDGLKSTSYSFLRIDSTSKIWAMVEKGEPVISFFSTGKWKTIINRQGLPSRVNLIYTGFDVYYQNKEPVFLVASERNGVFQLQNNRWTHFDKTNGLPSNYINSVLHFDGKDFIATEKGLSILSNNSIETNIFGTSPYLSEKIMALAVEDKFLWILGENWLGFICDGKFSLATEDFSLPVERNGRKCFLQADRMGRIYFGNLFKVLCYDKKNGKVENLKRSNGLISEGANAVLIDREFNTWIGGVRGITKILSRRFASFFNIDGLFSNEVASGLEISPGHYVFGHDGALTFYDGKSFRKFLLDPSHSESNLESRVLEISKDQQQNLWVAVSSKGLARIDKNEKIIWYRAAQGLEGMVFSVLCTSDGKIYAGTSTGFYKLTGERFIKILFDEIHGFSVRKIFPGRENSIFLLTLYHGIIEVKKDTVIDHISHDNPAANNVFSFLIDSRNRRWAGTSAGLYIIKESVLVRSGDAGPVINRPVYCLLEDQTGRLWFGCDNGVYRWGENGLDHFSISEGISGHEINRSAGFMDFQHHIWFGTNNGLTVYVPELDYDLTKVPPPIVSLLDVVSENDSLNPGNPQNLPYDMNNLTFHFRAISFIDEKKVVYQYKLEGLDTSWSNVVTYMNNSIRYNNLRPGSYRFCVKAANSLGIWSKPVCSALIIVRQPFWFRWWFILMVAILIGGIIVLTGRYVLIIRYNVRLEEAVSARTRELELSEQKLKESNQAKDNFFSIIAHDLKSPFHVILGMLDLLTTGYSEYSDEERHKMLLRLKNASTRTINLLENLLTWARAQRGLLPYTPEKLNIAEIIQENVQLFESAAHSKDILIKQTGEMNLFATADRNMINTIVRNLISNAIKFTFPGGNITIHIGYHNPDQILVYVKDTGFGMSPIILNNLFKIENRMVMKGTNNEMGTGLGLILSKDFIEKNKGKIWVTSEEGVGSCFYFTLPLYRPGQN